jgi:hypothetical protein
LQGRDEGLSTIVVQYRPRRAGEFPGAENKYFTQFEMVEEPEQERYTAVPAISPTDLTRPEQVYVFVPSLRRYQTLSPSARSARTWEPTRRLTIAATDLIQISRN